MKYRDDHIENLIIRHLTDSISDEEVKLLTLWRTAEPDNEALYNQYKKINELALAKINPASDAINIDIDEEWTTLQQLIEERPAGGINQETSFPGWLRIAATVVIVALSALVVYNVAFKSTTNTIYADTSGKQVTLPDGSKITLNAHSSITYPKVFDQQSRVIQLSGEGFFEVTKNPDQPFVVIVGDAFIKVLGTSFNVRSYAHESTIDVVVVTGVVKLVDVHRTDSVILSSKEKGTFYKKDNQLTKKMNNDINYLAWKSRHIVFNDMELGLVIQTLNKLYDANISFTTMVGINCKVTVTFDDQSLDSVLSVLEATLDLTYKRTGENIEIVAAGC